jgi:uncharacterized phage protein gp47/JayE
MAVSLTTYNEILGKLIRKLVADTPVNDINRGSVLLDLLEAVATQDFENNAAILSVLETLSIDSLKNADLDARAADYGLTRISAARATGFVKIYDTSISKRSTTLYAVKPPPIAGTTVIYVNDASAWSATGTLYVGRGTQQFEGPINYNSIVDNGSFFTITLTSALQKDHLISDSVVDGQGTVDRLVPTGTVVKIPANNQNPEILYNTLRDAVVAAGEDSVSDIPIISVAAGSVNNAGINSIINFNSLPFPTAAVTNTNALTDGRDVESDDELRERLKAYSATLARGTREAILSAIIGVSDATDGKQVSSAVITEPPSIGDPSIVYLDDGSGFQPTYQGQGVDVLLNSAIGDEEFLQLANFPLPRPQVINQAEGPYALTNGMKFRVSIDEIEEEVTFTTSQFSNIAAATLSEIVVAINDQASSFRCRLTDTSSRLLIYPVVHNAEYIQVSALRAGEDINAYANAILKFPTNKYSYITLYQNNTLLTEKETSATLQSNLFNSWAVTSSGNLIIEVDNTPPQDRSFSTLDFDSAPFTSLSLSDWVTVFNTKFAGLTATETSSGRLQIVSNKIGSNSALKIVGGSYFNQMFGGAVLESAGKSSDFLLNRQTGNLQMKTTITAADSISAGTADAKGNIVSSATTSGTYNLTSDSSSRPSELVVAVDSANVVPRTGVSAAIGNTITISSPSSGVMRVMGNTNNMLSAAQIGDYLYIANRGDVSGTGTDPWIDVASCGLYKVVAKGEHVTAGVDSYLDVENVNPVVGGPYIVQSEDDLQAFGSDVYPQLWKGNFTPSPGAATLQNIVDSFTKDMLNVKGSIFKTNSIKTTSTTENDGAVAIPVSVGRLSNIIASRQGSLLGNQSHIATKISQRDLVSMFRRTSPTGTNVFLDRFSYSDVKDTIDVNAVPNPSGYSEILTAAGTLTTSNITHDDILNITGGSNKSQFRSIKEFLGGNQAGTQVDTPTTIFDYLSGDDFEVVRPLSVSAEDSIVFIIDGDAVNKTINVNFWRTGRVNSLYSPSNTAFSANDADNEAGVTFGSLQVWSKANSGAEFKDYAVWMRSHNWYRSGGAASSDATMIVRAKEYGPAGDKHRFSLEYPTLPDQAAVIKHTNNPGYTQTNLQFASGSERSTGIVGGTTFKVTSLGGDSWRYTFQEGYVSLAALAADDILSLTDSSGVSTANRGSFKINNFNVPGKYVDVYNPNGVATSIGQPEITDVTTIADVVGTSSVHDVTCTAQGATGSTVGNSEYFTIYDDVGLVVFWYDIDNAGAAQPTVVGASRYVEIATVATGDSASTVASKTAVIVSSDLKFSATALGSVVTITLDPHGPTSAGAAGPNTGFTVTQTVVGTPDVTLGGKYFKLADNAGSVAVWFDVYGEAMPPHGASRSIQVTLLPGDSANTVATKIATIVNGDAQYSASAVGNVVTITDATNGTRADATANTSGFSISVTQQGTADGVETITITSGCHIFPLTLNDVQSICDKINTSSTLIAAPVGNNALLFTKATRQETYSYSGNASALGYDHDPNPANNKNSFISLFDGESFVKTFSNSNPQFVLKKDLILPGVVPAIYAMDTAPNSDSADLGEFFKLLPKTVKNVKHHLSHKALSQLPIVADVDIAGNFRRVQVKSKKLGTAGAVEVVGGRANLGSFSISGDAQITPFLGNNYLELKVSAYPSTINTGDIVRVYNSSSAKRRSRLLVTDTMDFANPSSTNFDLRFNPKAINATPFTAWTISDVSGSYSKSAGSIWRWTHNDGGSKFTITGDSNGSVGVAPNEYQANGTLNASALEVYEYTNGTVSTPVTFALSANATPAQGDYYAFQSTSAVTFAVWFSVNGNVTAPTGATYVAATNKIMVSILSTDTPDQAISKLAIALGVDVNFNAQFSGLQVSGTDLTNVVPGDLVNAYGSGSFLTLWNMRNQSQASGTNEISGFPVVAVNAASRYMDILNPNGIAQSATAPGLSGTVAVNPTPAIRFRLKHAAKSQISTIVVSSGVATVTTVNAHGLGIGDTAVVADAGNVGLNGSQTVASTPTYNSYTFSTGVADGTYGNGNSIRSGLVDTRYRVEKLGFNGLVRIHAVGGNSPYFADSGIAVDDFISLSGTTFKSTNNGRFRVLGVDNDSVIIKSEQAAEELHTYVSFNNLSLSATWTTNSTQVTGIAGTFKNLAIGDWVRKDEDTDEFLVQVVSFDTGIASTATIVNLGSQYRGVSSAALGISFDQNSDVDQGVTLKSVDDIQVYEGDSIATGDSLVIENIASSDWFNTANSGVREITAFGTFSPDKRPFVRVVNGGGVAESARKMSVKVDGVYMIEGVDNKYETIRQVDHAAISQFNSNYRTLYITPPDRSTKMAEIYGTKIESMGKLGFDVSVTTGVDGYTYYVGLMRTVQRIIDGFEPDPSNYPGRRAVGSSIEPLPPLIKQVSLALDVTTRDGVNLTDISNDIKSAIIGYVNSLNVGGDVILSEIVARIMAITGVDAVTFTSPTPNTERIAVADDQKALTNPDLISLA